MSSDSKLGAVIAEHYVLSERFLQREFSEFYKAIDLRLGRNVTLCFVKPESYDSSSDREQLCREAEAIAKLNSPHIIWLIDFGSTEQFGPYFVAEELQGKTLREELGRVGNFTLRRALKILIQVSLALRELHQHLFFNSRLTPDSILLFDTPAPHSEAQTMQYRQEDFIKIIDLSRIIVARDAEKPLDLPTHSMDSDINQYMYCAPESLGAKSLTAASDIYLWGILAYELLTGGTPFQTDAVESLIDMHLNLIPAPIKGYPDELVHLVFKSLQKDPKERPDSADTLLKNCLRCWNEFFPDEELHNPIDDNAVLFTRYRDANAVKAISKYIQSRSQVPNGLQEQRGSEGPSAEPAIGTVITNYRLIRLLGEGGMGRVFLAEHVVIGNKLACKILHADIANRPEIQHRFINEARAMAALQHPNITAVYDCGILPTGAVYILMEFITGRSLTALVREQGPLSEKKSLLVAQQLASALSHAHGQGIIHRDLKPDNILLIEGKGDDSLRVKITDFGIAKLEGALSSRDIVTKSNVIMGTPAYMSPEQIRSSGRVDHRADLYSLGAVLYFTLTGHSPFGSEAETVGEFLSLSLTEPVPPIKNRHVSAQYTKIIFKLLEKLPNLRYQTADILLKTIDSQLVQQGIPRTAIEETPRRPAESSRARQLGALFATNIGTSMPPEATQRANWHIITAHLPHAIRNHASSIQIFLSKNFESCAPISPHILQLNGVRLSNSSEYQYFVVFMEGSAATDEDAAELGTRTFRNYTTPLEAHLERFRSETLKVIIVIADTIELGRGVREKILDYRVKFNAFVVPLYVGEIEKSAQAGRFDNLFIDRLTDLHTTPDYFANDLRPGSPTNIFGIRGFINDLTSLLKQQTALVSIFGVPGAGKSTLISMLEYSLDNSRFRWIRCDALLERTIDCLTKEIAELFLGEKHQEQTGDGPAQPTAKDFNTTLLKIADNSSLLKQKSVLVLENADWLLEQLRPASATGDSTDRVRDFLTRLATFSQSGALSIIITSIRGFILASRVLNGWENPVASVVRCYMAPPIEFYAASRMMQELGIQMNVRFDSKSIRLIYQNSGGNVAIIRKICSHIVKQYRQNENHNVLAPITVSGGDAAWACQDLIATRATFGETILPWLGQEERLVLYQISVFKPRNLEQLKQALIGTITPDQIAKGLDLLQQLGLVRKVKGRLRITLPLLEEWVKNNVEQSHAEIQRVKARRFRLISVGMASTALLFIVYWQVFQLSMMYDVLQSVNGCSYSVKYPKTGIDNVELYFFRSCKSGGGSLPPKVKLMADSGTVAVFGQQYGEFDDVLRCPVEQPACPQNRVPVKLVSPLGDSYKFIVTYQDKALGAFSIRHDKLAYMRRTLDDAMKIATLMPAFLGIVAAFFRDWLNAMRRLQAALFGRKKSSSSGPPSEDDKP